jgi:hypothetical protein
MLISSPIHCDFSSCHGLVWLPLASVTAGRYGRDFSSCQLIQRSFVACPSLATADGYIGRWADGFPSLATADGLRHHIGRWADGFPSLAIADGLRHHIGRWVDGFPFFGRFRRATSPHIQQPSTTSRCSLSRSRDTWCRSTSLHAPSPSIRAGLQAPRFEANDHRVPVVVTCGKDAHTRTRSGCTGATTADGPMAVQCRLLRDTAVQRYASTKCQVECQVNATQGARREHRTAGMRRIIAWLSSLHQMIRDLRLSLRC